MGSILRTLFLIPICAGLACSSSSSPDHKGAQQKGPHFVSYDGFSLDAGLSTRFAARNLGEDWLVLQMSLISRSGSFELHRRDISVRDPSGNRLPLISREEFRLSYPQFRSAFLESEIAGSDPWEETTQLPQCGWFFVQPSRGLSQDSIYLTPQRRCVGPFVFQVPGGVQPGRWVLMIDLEEDDVRIPFQLQE